MGTFGISSTGFTPKKLSDILQSLKLNLQTVTDPDTGEQLQIDFESNDPFVQMLNSFAQELADCWDMLGLVYSQFNPLQANGASLSGLVQLNGITRYAGSPSSVILTFTGDNGALVPAGTRCTDEENNVIWKTISNVYLAQNGGDLTASGSVTAKATVNGPIEADVGTIIKIMDELPSVTSVINEIAAIPGDNDESDAALRLRRERSIMSYSRGMAESIHAAIIALDGVQYCKIYTNRTNDTDARGISAKSIAVIVQGGDDEQIAKQIFNRAGLCTGFYGETAVIYQDTMGVSHEVRFTRPTAVPVIVSITIEQVEGGFLETGYADKIKENIIAFAQKGVAGLGISTDKFDTFGFPVGEDVTVSRLYTPINAVKGVKVSSLLIKRASSTDAASADDISILWNEVAEFSPDNITITLNNG